MSATGAALYLVDAANRSMGTTDPLVRRGAVGGGGLGDGGSKSQHGHHGPAGEGGVVVVKGV